MSQASQGQEVPRDERNILEQGRMKKKSEVSEYKANAKKY